MSSQCYGHESSPDSESARTTLKPPARDTATSSIMTRMPLADSVESDLDSMTRIRTRSVSRTYSSSLLHGRARNPIPKRIQNVNLIPKEKKNRSGQTALSRPGQALRRAVSCEWAKSAPLILEEHAHRGTAPAMSRSTGREADCGSRRFNFFLSRLACDQR